MATNPLFHNNTVNINDVWFESHNSMLQQICVELGHSDKIDEMREKFLGAKLKMKAYKDPNKPKRAKSAYFYFCDDARTAVLKSHRKKAGKNGKINMGNVAKELAVQWRAIVVKTKYTDLAKTDTERYANAMSVYNDKNGN